MKETTAFIGIDLGTKQTGVCIIEIPKSLDADPKSLKAQLHTITSQPGDRPTPTIFRIVQEVCEYVVEYTHAGLGWTPIVMVEKPFNIKGHGTILFEMLGALKHQLFGYGKRIIIPYEVSQITLKMYATNKSKAQKSDMAIQAFRESNGKVDSMKVGEDAIDAYWLARMGHTMWGGKSTSDRRKRVDKYKSDWNAKVLKAVKEGKRK